MNALTLERLIEKLPPGRARDRYQRLMERIGDAVSVMVPYSHQPLWLVPDVNAARILTTMGIPRWRIWTLRELQALTGAFGTPIQTLTQAAEVLADRAGQE